MLYWFMAGICAGTCVINSIIVFHNPDNITSLIGVIAGMTGLFSSIGLELEKE